MRWIKCNYRHALGGRYDYFWQSPTTSSRWLSFGNGQKLVQALRHHHGPEFLDPPSYVHISQRQWNPKWFLDQRRNRIWIKEETLVLLQLRGIG